MATLLVASARVGTMREPEAMAPVAKGVTPLPLLQ
jgi:hypothetical protein